LELLDAAGRDVGGGRANYLIGNVDSVYFDSGRTAEAASYRNRGYAPGRTTTAAIAHHARLRRFTTTGATPGIGSETTKPPNEPVIAPPPAPFLEQASDAGGGVMTETNTQLNFISATVSPNLPLNGSDGHGT
jgi:hypothetical protein